MKKQVKKTSGTMVYCGPTLVGICKCNTMFTNGLPPALSALIAAKPEFQGLVVELENLPEARQQIQNKKGKIYTLYQRAQKQ